MSTIPVIATVKRGAPKTFSLRHVYPGFISPGVPHPQAGQDAPIEVGDFLRVAYKASGQMGSPPPPDAPELDRMIVAQSGSRWLITLSGAQSQALAAGRYYADARQFNADGTTERFAATVIFMIETNITGAANP